jgi:hypothetical protein
MHIIKHYLITALLCTHTMFLNGMNVTEMDIIEREHLLNNQPQEVDTTINIHKQDPKKLVKQSKFLSFSTHNMVKKLTLAKQAVVVDPTSEKNLAYLKKLTQLAWYYRYCPTFIFKGGRKKVFELMQEHNIEQDTSWKNFKHSFAFMLKKDVVGSTISTALIYSLILYSAYKLTNLIPITKRNNNPKYLDFHDCLPHKTHIEDGLIKTNLIHFDKQLDSIIEECVACAKDFTNPVAIRCSTPTCGRSCHTFCHDKTLPQSTCNKFVNLTKNPTHSTCNPMPFRWLTYTPLIFIPIIEATSFGLRKIKQKLTACVRRKKKQIFEIQEDPEEQPNE